MMQLESVMVSLVPVRKMSMPPPVWAYDGSLAATEFLPLWIVTPSMVTCKLLCVPSWLIPKILLSLPSATGKLPLMMVLPAPAPWIIMFWLMSRSPEEASARLLALVMVRLNVPAGKEMVQLPIVAQAALAFASMIAARRLQLPPLSAQVPLPGAASTVSLVVFTVKIGSPGGGVTVGVTWPACSVTRAFRP